VISALLVGFISCASSASPLYQVEKDGKVNWLLGTIHLPISADAIPLPIVDKARRARVILTETGSHTDNVRLGREASAVYRASSTREFANLFSGIEKIRLRSFLKKSGLDWNSFAGKADMLIFNELEPVFNEAFARALWIRVRRSASALANLDASIRGEGLSIPGDRSPYAGEPTLDLQLVAIAEAQGRTVQALDSVPDQLRMLGTRMPDAELKKWIRSGLNRITLADDMDEDRLVEVALEQIRGVEENRWIFYRAWTPNGRRPEVRFLRPISMSMLDIPYSGPLKQAMNRHAGWMKAIEEAYAQGSALVAVGDNHLFEANGILEILQAQGYTVTFIGDPCGAALLAGQPSRTR
jgi:uncharacterized protein YbaP (TraB family)